MGKCIITRRGSINSNIKFDKWEHTSGNNGYIINKDGWISNITSQNLFIGINKPFVYTQSFEIMLNFILTNKPSRSNTLIGSCVGFYKAPSVEIQQNKIWAGFSYLGSTWDKNLTYDFESYELNKEYYLKYSYDASLKKLKLELSSDNISWNLLAQESDVEIGYQGKDTEYLEIGGVAQSVNHYFSCGKINIFKSYIKTDGTLFWGIQYE